LSALFDFTVASYFFFQAEAIAARKGIALPQEFLAAAAQGGLRQSILYQYALLQVSFYGRRC
jgi:hypothetical protein